MNQVAAIVRGFSGKEGLKTLFLIFFLAGLLTGCESPAPATSIAPIMSPEAIKLADWNAKVASIQIGDSPAIVKKKLGIEQWWEEYKDLYGAFQGPNLDIFIGFFEKGKLSSSQVLHYGDYVALARIEREHAEQKERDKYLDGHPDVSDNIRSALQSGKLCVGMNAEQAELTRGKPEKKAVSAQAEQWIYKDKTYLYFSEGSLLSWQKTE